MIVIEGLHNRQKEIARGIISSSCKFHSINASRQSGKTHLLGRLIPALSLSVKCNILVVAPSYAQSSELFDRVRSIDNIELLIKTTYNSKPQRIVFDNGTVVHFRSADRPDVLRGGSYDYVICDEFRFFKKGVFEEVIRPTTAAKIKSKIILVSTPKGKSNDFYKYCSLGMSSEESAKNYAYYYMSYMDNHFENGDPIFDLNEVEDAKLILPEKLFKQEYLAEFIDGSGDVFSNINKAATLKQFSNKSETNYAGLDLGKVNDSTVLHILNNEGNTTFIKNLKGKDWNDMLDEVIVHLKEYNAVCLIETNGGQSIAFDYISKRYSSTVAFNTSNSSKQDIIEQLILDINADKLHIPVKEVHPYLIEQLESFTFKYSPETRRIRYQAMEGFHDDEVMSLAFANKCRNTYRTNNIYHYDKLEDYGY